MTPPANTPLHVVIRPDFPDERPYLLSSWSEGYKNAPRMHSMPWAVYKRHVVPELGAVLDRGDTTTLVAVQPSTGDIVGWLAFSRIYRTPTVHWAHTRFAVGKDGAHLRRRGVLTQLLAKADLGSRWAYTHRGPRQRVAGKETTDATIARALAARGVSAAYVSMEDWLR